MTLVLFHTADVNKVLFDELLESSGNTEPVVKLVRNDLLTRSEDAGSFTASLREETKTAMRSALADAGDGARLLCTCSTIGPAADDLAASGEDVARVDRALAKQAFAQGPKVAVLYAVETTKEPTYALFSEVADEMGVVAELDMIFVEGAWPHFSSGDIESYHRVVAACVDGLAAGYDAIALGQASMHGASALTGKKVLTSPMAGLGLG